MGRLRSRNHDLPPGVHRKGARLYYGRNDVPLGPEGPEAWRKWAALRGDAPTRANTFADAVRDFELSAEFRALAPKTQREYARQLKFLCGPDYFGPAPLEQIRPAHIRAFLDRRPPIAGTREKAAFSRVFTYARERDLTAAPNPAAGIAGTKSARDIDVTDAMLAPVLRACTCPVTADYVETLYRTGADAGVAALWRRDAIVDGELVVQRTKTGAKVRIALVGPLAVIFERRLAGRVGNVYLFAREDGNPIGLQVLRRRFNEARKAVGEAFWLRDLRAKAATDAPDLAAAQRLLGHARESTTALYRRKRAGERAEPITRGIAEAKEELRK